MGDEKKMVTNMSWGNILSDVFSKHTKGETSQVLSRGLEGHVPEPDQMFKTWKKPYLFARLALIGLILSLITYIVVLFYGNILNSGAAFFLIFLMAFFPPMCIMIFSWEMNIAGTISVFEAVFFMMLGGVLSMLTGGTLLYLIPNIPYALGGPLPEEIAKVLIICILMRRQKMRYGLEGLVIGCCVGAGFAAVETAGYGLDIALTTGGAIYTLIIRGLLSLGGHAAWGMIYGTAIGLAKRGSRKMKGTFIADPLVILTVLAVFIMHFLWNLNPVQLLDMMSLSMVQFIAKAQDTYIWYIVLIIISWILALFIIRRGVRQLIEVNNHAVASGSGSAGPQGAHPVSPAASGVAQATPAQPVKAPSATKVLTVQGKGGVMDGRVFELMTGGSIVFGRDSQKSKVTYASDTKGISSVHCEIKVKNGFPVLIDRGSSFGTFFSNGEKLEANVPYKLADGVEFYLAMKEQSFIVRI